MSETIIAALIGAGITLITTIITVFVNAHIENDKRKREIRQKDFETKRNNLTKVYKKLLSIINLYPNASPNDLLNNIEYPPEYSMESFDTIIDILKWQIDDYAQDLKNSEIALTQKNKMKVEILNREYLIKQIAQIRDDYFNASGSYREFCKTDKMIFDLYAGQDVKNSLADFEVAIHNTFTSGHSVGNIYDPTNNTIDRIRQEMINYMRNDLGIIDRS